MNKKTVSTLKDLLDSIAQNEKLVERQRINLNNMPKFNPYAGFTRIDKLGINKIKPLDIYEFCHDNKAVHVSMEDCNILVNYFDTNNDCQLDYQDFLQIVLPCTHAKVKLYSHLLIICFKYIKNLHNNRV